MRHWRHVRRRVGKQEASVAADVGGRTTAASGATPHSKGDVRAAHKLRVECKSTTAPQFRLPYKVVQKIILESVNGGEEEWAIQLQFVGQGSKTNFAFIAMDQAERLGLPADQYGVVEMDDSQTVCLRRHTLMLAPLRIHWHGFRYVCIPWSVFIGRRDM